LFVLYEDKQRPRPYHPFVSNRIQRKQPLFYLSSYRIYYAKNIGVFMEFIWWGCWHLL